LSNESIIRHKRQQSNALTGSAKRLVVCKDNHYFQRKNEKALLMEEIKEAVEELKLIRKGKLKGIPAKQLLDEL